MSGLDPLLSLGTLTLWNAFAVFLRVGAAIAVLPALGESWLSVRVKLLIALLLTVIILPAVVPRLEPPAPGLAGLGVMVATETLSGLSMGIALRLFVLAIQTAGAIAAQSTSLSQLLGNAGADPLPAVGHVLAVSALALLMTTGFHVKAAAFLILSYDLLPAFRLPDPALLADAGRRRVGEAFALAFVLAAPFVIMSMLYNLTLGVINKAMPQLMVAFVGAPVITFGAIVMLFLCAPVMLATWLAAFDGFLSAPFR